MAIVVCIRLHPSAVHCCLGRNAWAYLEMASREFSELELIGGHIGADIRRSERKKGYGTLILKLTLEKAAEVGLKKVLITCDAENTASAKTIEKCGGKLDKRVIHEETGKLIFHYWIDL